jgi:hypothetical protein
LQGIGYEQQIKLVDTCSATIPLSLLAVGAIYPLLEVAVSALIKL